MKLFDHSDGIGSKQDALSVRPLKNHHVVEVIWNTFHSVRVSEAHEFDVFDCFRAIQVDVEPIRSLEDALEFNDGGFGEPSLDCVEERKENRKRHYPDADGSDNTDPYDEGLHYRPLVDGVCEFAERPQALRLSPLLGRG
jgi:hypothetical protein